MPYSHPRHWRCALLVPRTTVAFRLSPRSRHVASTLPPPVAGAGSQEHCRVLGGARSATLGPPRPFQAVMWGVPGQLAT